MGDVHFSYQRSAYMSASQFLRMGAPDTNLVHGDLLLLRLLAFAFCHLDALWSILFNFFTNQKGAQARRECG